MSLCWDNFRIILPLSNGIEWPVMQPSSAFPLQKSVALPPRSTKTRLGCQACKKRHIRCDLTRPTCNCCKKRGTACPGYAPLPLKWVQGSTTTVPSRSHKLHSVDTNGVEARHDSLRSQNINSDAGLRNASTRTSQYKDMRGRCHQGIGNEAVAAVLPRPENKNLRPTEKVQNQPVVEYNTRSDGNNSVEQLRPTSSLSVSRSRELGGDSVLREFLAGHYFSSVASIFTIFDSPENPFGQEIAQLVSSEGMSVNSTIINTVISIAAVHLADCTDDIRMRNYGLHVRSKAIVGLTACIAANQWRQNAFASSILLCMTESYFRHEACGVQYLESAKSLALFDHAAYQQVSRGLRNAMCWLEALTSLVTDYSGITYESVPIISEIDERDCRNMRLDVLEHPPRLSDPVVFQSVDPLLGTWAALLPLIGKLGRVIYRMRKDGYSNNHQKDLEAIEAFLLGWECDINLDADINLPHLPNNDDTATDTCNVGRRHSLQTPCQTPAAATTSTTSGRRIPETEYLSAMAHAYRLAGLLELYQRDPGLTQRRMFVVTALSFNLDPKEFLQDLSSTVIRLLQKIPAGSRLFNVASFPLMTAGQFCTTIEDRAWVRAVFEDLRVRNGITAVTRLMEALEQVWERRDQGRNQAVTWIDIFEEWNYTMLIN